MMAKAGRAKLLPTEKVLASWQAPEFIHHEKGGLWFALATIVTFLLIVNAILNKQWTAAIVFALLLGVIYLFAHEQPRQHIVVISNIGIHVGGRFYPFAEVKSFWLVYHDNARTFNFQTTGGWGTTITVQLDDLDPALIRSALQGEVPEEKNKYEPFLDKLGRWLKI